MSNSQMTKKEETKNEEKVLKFSRDLYSELDEMFVKTGAPYGYVKNVMAILQKNAIAESK